ncbi:MAG TPA: polysaccharide biosynthesis tyrosine autokinase [Terracidiphilus sp.]|nr:polysaccharide biosynthesis tyrosine autokinase [Terracidiphilus sp.]
MPKQLKLTEVLPPDLRSRGTPPAYYAPITLHEEVEAAGPTVPLSHYLWIFRRHIWKIVAAVATCVIATLIVSARLQRIYQSTATVNVDRQAPSEVVGEDSTRFVAPNDADQFLATQIKLIQSDAVLRPVAEQYHLLSLEGQTSSASDEREQLLASAPITLKRLRVTRSPNTYLLLISYRSPDAHLAADVANAIADSYLLQTYDLRIRSAAGMSTFMEKQLDELKAKMERSNLALAQFEKDLDVINPEEKTNILSARLLQLNTDYTAAQADRVRAEASWNAIKSGSLEAAEASSQGDTLIKLYDTLDQARQRFAVVKATYGTNHPEYRKAASELAEVEKQFDDTRRSIAERVQTQYQESLNREQMLQASVNETKAEWDRVNAKSFQYQQLKQEADADKALYDELIKKIREADINAGFQNNNIRIADVARPSLKPVFPNMTLNLVLAFLFSCLLAIGGAILLDSLDTTLRDADEASRFLGADVIATLPVDRAGAQLPRKTSEVAPATLVPRNGHNGHRKDYYGGVSSFDEAIRSLRNTILLSDFDSRLHSIVLTSATPGEGKTTLAAHLAMANADRGKKTLLVDGDLRHPSLHSKFGLNPHTGLSNVLTGEFSWEEVVIPIEGTTNLSLIPAGLGSHRAADLIGPRLSTLLDEFAKKYDLVILDSPPLLGFAECLQMAAAADGVLLVSRAGETKRRAVAEVIAALRRLRANIVGVVLNRVSHDTSAGGYQYSSYYQKHYANYYKSGMPRN